MLSSLLAHPLHKPVKGQEAGGLDSSPTSALMLTKLRKLLKGHEFQAPLGKWERSEQTLACCQVRECSPQSHL